MTTTLVLTETLPEPGMRVLRARLDVALRVLAAPTQAALNAALPGADGVILVMERPSLGARAIERAPRLRVACRFGAGYDNFDLAALSRRRIPLATTGAANAETVAEHALYLMLALAKRGPSLERSVRRGKWPRAFGAIELAGLTCLLVGYGHIGRAIAPRAAAFGMRVVVFDPGVTAESIVRDGYECAPGVLASALPEADFLVLACALNAATRRLIGAAMLRRMKPGAFVVNVARGAIVDERALARALRAGRIAGAGLDVFATEPLPRDSALLGCDNVVLTPHTAAYVRTAFDRMALACAQCALDGLDGRLDATRVVNPEVFRS